MRLPLHLLFTKLDFFDLNQATANAKAVVATTPYLLAYRPHSSKGLQARLLLCPEKESSPGATRCPTKEEKRESDVAARLGRQHAWVARSSKRSQTHTTELLDQVSGF
jgi:hypothetical protein